MRTWKGAVRAGCSHTHILVDDFGDRTDIREIWKWVRGHCRVSSEKLEVGNECELDAECFWTKGKLEIGANWVIFCEAFFKKKKSRFFDVL